MKLRTLAFASVDIVVVPALVLAGIEVHHRLRFGHFVGYGVHADVVESPSEIGVPGVKTVYAARLSNYTLLPSRLVGWECVGDVGGSPPRFSCRFQLQKLSPQDGHWIVMIDFKPTAGARFPVASKRLYPLHSLVPMDWGAYGLVNGLRKEDLLRFAIFTKLYEPEAEVYTEPFRISDVRTPGSTSARSTQ
jgi:hypothetical protein